MTKRASLLTLCISFLLVIGACSGSGSPVTANPGADLTKYASSVEGYIYQGGAPVTSGRVLIYDLSALELFNDAEIGPNGSYIAGIDEGQYLVFPVSPTGWSEPCMEAEFSSYINAEADKAYRMDVELGNELPDGEDLVFGFVTSSENDEAVAGATVSAAGRSTRTDGYGFYAMTVPSGTGAFTVSAPGFHELRTNIREGQATDDFFDTPFFQLNPKDVAGASLGGIVRDMSDGTGLGGVRITLEMPANESFGQVQYLTNLGGEYRFFNLIEGIYKMTYERPGYITGTREGLVLKEQDDAIINVFMSRDLEGLAVVHGRVTSASMDIPISGARVTASNPLLGSHMRSTDFTGGYTMDNVVPENYTITVVVPGTGVSFYEAASTFHTVIPGDNEVNFSLRFINEGVLRGSVAIEGGMGILPPTGIYVTAVKIGGPLSGVEWRTTSDGKGIFVFNGLPAGLYLVEGLAEYGTLETYYGRLESVSVNAGTTTNVDLLLSLEW